MTMFKNLFPYQLAEEISESDLRAIESRPFVPLGANDVMSSGFVPVFDDCEDLIYPSAGYWVVALRVDTKTVPSALIKQHAAERVKKIEEAEGRKVGRKELREMKEMIAAELLPRAFPKTKIHRILIDDEAKRVLVEASSENAAFYVLSVLRDALGELPTRLYQGDKSATACMTAFVEHGIDHENLSLGYTANMESADKRVTIRNQSLDCAEAKEAIATGKECTALGLEWADKISFTLTLEMAIKSIRSLDVLDDQISEEIKDCADKKSARDSALFMELSELRLMLSDLFEELGIE
jgi:recombination associated protein RdgC